MLGTVLIINGATRASGNTDILIQRIIEGSTNAGVKTELVELRRKSIADCIGCYQCLRESTCSLKDDMAEIREEMHKADLIILASPLYWCGVTGLMKNFIDRLYFYYHPQNRRLIAGKKAIIVTTLNQKDAVHESGPLVEFYNRLLSCLGIEIASMFFFSDIMTKGAALNKPEYLEQAYSIGKNLPRWI
jgi:multimeric flavodoxin WrbA